MDFQNTDKIKIGIICRVNGKPVDILLPIINNDVGYEKKYDSVFSYFVYSMAYTKVLLFYICDKEKKLARIDIRSSCKLNERIALYIIKKSNNQYFLRVFTNEHLNGLYHLPF